jgi:hypothetical protein
LAGQKTPPKKCKKMIKFTPLEKDVLLIKDYIEKSEVAFCDISIGAKYIWRDDFKIDYAIFNDTLILKESCRDYQNAFYYPMGQDISGALLEIENYCIEKNQPLLFLKKMRARVT